MARSKAKQFTKEDDALLGELGVEAEQKQVASYTAKQERIIAGFEDIQRFVQEHGRAPQHGEDRNIFERLYAVRLDRIRGSEECNELLIDMDEDGLLKASAVSAAQTEGVTDDELLEALGVEADAADDVTQIKFVRSQVDRKPAVEVAQRKPCEDFDTFRPVFEQVQRALKNGDRQTAKFQHDGKMDPGDMFILDGQIVLVAGAGELIMKEFGREDRRLRVIYDNGTESNLLLRSLQRAMYKRENSRRILPPAAVAAPLFSDQTDAEDLQSGTIYVLRSRSDNPFIQEHRMLIHKIGVTGGTVKNRIRNAKKDPTYLLADVEVVETFKLANVNRKSLETLLHRFFASARLDLELKDRFGSQVQPREWFLVPLPAIEEAIQRIVDGTIEGFRYDTEAACLTDE
jgi:Meiotically Up-regulated Gene 113 (MUG113) protein